MSAISSVLLISSLLLLSASPARPQSTSDPLKAILDRNDPDHMVGRAGTDVAQAGCKANSLVATRVSGNDKDLRQNAGEAGATYARVATALDAFSRTNFAQKRVHQDSMSVALDEEFARSSTLEEMARRIAVLAKKSAEIANKIASGKASPSETSQFIKQSQAIPLDFALFLDAIASS